LRSTSPTNRTFSCRATSSWPKCTPLAFT
jgi:hypothetical protein